MELVNEFEVARPRLVSMAHRILGSREDAEDAVQTAWLRFQAADRLSIENPAAWFTTVTARICLDQLRARDRRGELPLFADALPDDQLAADEDFLRREAVSRALMVLLTYVPPGQRVAYVLHDLFGVAFDDIAQVLGTSATNAKKSASRARRRLAGAGSVASEQTESAALHRPIVDAFFAAARDGRLEELVALMAPGVVRVADRAVLPEGGATEVVGRRAVAEETRFFIDRIGASVAMLVDDVPALVIAPGGHPMAVITFAFDGELITRITITAIRASDRLIG